MKVLLTLIKRQLIDNAFYFAIAAVIASVLVVAVIAVTLSEQLTYLSSYALALILITPIFFCAASYAVGLSQIYIDRSIGISALLPTLPVRDWQIHFARFLIGTLIILMVLGPLAITGAILWRLLGPPQWLFHNWVADVFIGLSLTCMACYCLGLDAGRSGGSLLSALRPLPLTIIVLLLVLIKGFGSPLLSIFVPLVILLLLQLWKQPVHSRVKMVATGFATLFFFAVPLYLVRHYSDGLLARAMDEPAKISPSGLFPIDIENDPNAKGHSEITSRYWIRSGGVFAFLCKPPNWKLYDLQEPLCVLEPLGITDYVESLKRGERRVRFCSINDSIAYFIHLDQSEGLLICRQTETDKWTDFWNNIFTWKWEEISELYAGPGGVSKIPNDKLGRFGNTIIQFGPPEQYFIESKPRCVVFDKDLKCFFIIDFEKQKIHRGPELKNLPIQPISVGSSGELDLLLLCFDIPPTMGASYERSDDLPVLGESGQIYALDPNTLELQGPVGQLPLSRTAFGQSSSKPNDLLDYKVNIFNVGPTKWEIVPGEELLAYDKGEKHPATIAASLSRQGMWTSVAVFDKDGRLVKTAHSQADFFKQPWGPALTVGKYVFENLHPPVLTLASFFTAYSFDARSAHRALFLMPNSFVAMARDYQGNIFYKFVIVLLLMLPGLLLAGILALRVELDAAEIGLSLNARRFWLIATLIFGLVGYITYKLTRPGITLVTCANCGNPRRPDMKKCHRCGSGWHVPEITPPHWRVLDGMV